MGSRLHLRLDLVGLGYAAFVIDAYARRILGWSVATTMTTQLVLDARRAGDLDPAPRRHLRSERRRPSYGPRIPVHLGPTPNASPTAGIKPSIGAVGCSYDNALAETINGLYKTELIKPRGPWRSVDDVEIATAEWVDWFNHRRLYEYCDDIPPVEVETAHYAHHQTPAAGGVSDQKVSGLAGAVQSVAEQRYQAVMAVIGDGLSISQVAEKVGVSRQTLHAWLARYEAEGLVVCPANNC